MIPAARKLLERLRSENEPASLKEPVVRIKSAYAAMKRGAESIEMAPITHHDLRHLFATICIESGVDIPTVSRWLGHRDGGVLAMKVYGHLRNEHSLWRRAMFPLVLDRVFIHLAAPLDTGAFFFALRLAVRFHMRCRAKVALAPLSSLSTSDCGIWIWPSLVMAFTLPA